MNMKDYYTKKRQQRIKDYKDYDFQQYAEIIESRPVSEKLQVKIWIR